MPQVGSTKRKSPSQRLPQVRLHKPSGQAYVRVRGRMVYLGPWGTDEAHAAYSSFIVEYLSGGPVPGTRREGGGQGITIAEVMAAYLRHAREYYRRPNGLSPEVNNITLALKPLRQLFAAAPAAQFGPVALRTVRDAMIDSGWARTHINSQVHRIRRMFKWAASSELVPVTVYQSLCTLDGLKRGRTSARETEPVRPVPSEYIEAVRQRVSRQVQAIIDLQLLTAARPGELVGLRRGDILAEGAVWTAVLGEHKNAHHGLSRTIYFGPKAQGVLRPFMLRPADAYLFSPREAESERYARAEVHRRPNQRPNPKKSDRIVGEAYDVNGYRRAIARACEDAGIDTWGPNRLRHNAATELRREFGIETARVILGHSSVDTSAIYAEMDSVRAIDAIQQLG